MTNNKYNNMKQQAKVIPISVVSGRHPFSSSCILADDSMITDKRMPAWLILLMEKLKRLKYALVKNLQKVLLFCFLGLITACSKEDKLDYVEDIPGLGGDEWTGGTIDQWIYDSLTVPFNIAVKYKWDQFELSLNKTLVPPKEEKIIPVMSAVKKVWIDTYIAEAGEIFIRKYCPKFFALAGSASYNTDGTITLGTAEGGRKVVLYVLNDFRTKAMAGYQPSDSANIKQMFHTIEHEFGHILHQTILYPEEFKRISVGFYTANWNNVSDYNARRDGFVTAYAMASPDEDFVEMVSMMLVEGKAGFDRIVNSIPAGTSSNGVSQAEAKNRLRQKEDIVVSYFKDTWDIDFYSLQTRVRTAVEELIQ